MPCHASLTDRSDGETGETPPATGLKLVSGAAVEGGNRSESMCHSHLASQLQEAAQPLKR